MRWNILIVYNLPSISTFAWMFCSISCIIIFARPSSSKEHPVMKMQRGAVYASFVISSLFFCPITARKPCPQHLAVNESEGDGHLKMSGSMLHFLLEGVSQYFCSTISFLHYSNSSLASVFFIYCPSGIFRFWSVSAGRTKLDMGQLGCNLWLTTAVG